MGVERIERAFTALGITDIEVRRGRAVAGIPWLAAGAIALITAVAFALLNIGQVSFVGVLVSLLYGFVITLLILVLLRAALAISVEHEPIAWVVAIGGGVLVVVYWVLVHFITVEIDDLFAVGSLWRAVVLAVVGIALAVGTVKKDSGTREWVAGPLRNAQVAVVGYPPEPPKPVKTKGGWKALVKNPGATVMVVAAAVAGAAAAVKKK
ncbi:MAG: hypothetical protein ACQERF_02200 [Actinomycetota bacterium]